MHDDGQRDDRITAAVLSGSTYRRVRALRPPPFGGSLTTILARQAALLGVLALLLPLFDAFPASTAEFLSSTDPARASPQVLVLGMFGGALETFTGVVLVAVGITRIRAGPVDERRARRLVDFETFAAYVGYVTGGASIVLTLGYFCLGLAGGDAVAGYVEAMDGLNPFADSGIGVPVAHVAVLAFATALALLVAGSYLSVRLSESSSPTEG